MKSWQLPAALTSMGTSTLGLDFATMTPQIWIYVRAFLADTAPILIIIVGALFAFYVAHTLINILLLKKQNQWAKEKDMLEADEQERWSDFFYDEGDAYLDDDEIDDDED